MTQMSRSSLESLGKSKEGRYKTDEEREPCILKYSPTTLFGTAGSSNLRGYLQSCYSGSSFKFYVPITMRLASAMQVYILMLIW